MTNPKVRPSIKRALLAVEPAYQKLLAERYHRILPVLLLLLRPSDILERNRAWPGVKPIGKEATRLLMAREAGKARASIKAYAMQTDENSEELWRLFFAYCRYGPIGLIEALPSQLPLLVNTELQECADFHRLAKHPRTDAGMYIRELLDSYADALRVPRLTKFVARYGFAKDRLIDGWFFGESNSTESVTKTTRRQNRDTAYPHQRWNLHIAELPIQCLLARRHPSLITPWLVWCQDTCTQSLMGFRVCPSLPTLSDVLLTLRWSIWHYGAPWWKARGAPDILCLPQWYAETMAIADRALLYLHCRVVSEGREQPNLIGLITENNPSPQVYPGFPNTFSEWLMAISTSINQSAWQGKLELSELRTLLLSYIQDKMSTLTFAAPTPKLFVEQQVSLPWSQGIAAALLLPSAGRQTVVEGKISLFGVPFDATACSLGEGRIVDVRYDPDDAQAIYLVNEASQVAKADACAFEHHIPWSELINDLSVLEMVQ